MSKETAFNSMNGKLKIEDNAIVIEKSSSHMLNNGLQFSVKPDKIPIEDIENVYTDNQSGTIGKPKIIIEHSGKETEFRFYNKNNRQKIEGKKVSLNGLESADRFAELLESTADKDKDIKADTSRTEDLEGDKEEKEKSKEESEGFVSKMNKTKEYKRTCNECGETWHVLASRERKVKTQKAGNSMQQCGAALSCCFPMAALSQSNVQDSEDQLEKMRSCPECGSHNYDEETIRYEK